MNAINAIELPPLRLQLRTINGLPQPFLEHGLANSVLSGDLVLFILGGHEGQRWAAGQVNLLEPLLVQLLDEVAQQLVVDLLLYA